LKEIHEMEKNIFAKGLYWQDKTYVVTVTDREGEYVVEDNVSQIKRICTTEEDAIQVAKEWEF